MNIRADQLRNEFAESPLSPMILDEKGVKNILFGNIETKHWIAQTTQSELDRVDQEINTFLAENPVVVAQSNHMTSNEHIIVYITYRRIIKIEDKPTTDNQWSNTSGIIQQHS